MTARIVLLESAASTNAEALKLATAGETGPVWVVADRQTAGKGRSGRAWQGGDGNLFASHLVVTDAPLPAVAGVSLVAGVAAFDAIRAAIGTDVPPGLRLKWPNDLLIGSAKVGGILIETSPGPVGLAVVIGIGINIAQAPDLPDCSATALAAHGTAPARDALLEALTTAFDRWLATWDAGRNFATVRAAWLERAGPLGEPLTVNAAAGPVRGTFAGLDQDGSLLLADPAGAIRRFSFGDVTLGG